MRIGALRKRLALQSETLVVDENGGQIASWADVATVWAELSPISNKQVTAADVRGRITHEIIMRYRDDIKTGMRFLLGSRIFTIRFVSVSDEKNQWLDIMAEEGGQLG